MIYKLTPSNIKYLNEKLCLFEDKEAFAELLDYLSMLSNVLLNKF